MVKIFRIIQADELNHHGVKGMKWGVRRSEKRQARREARAEKKFQKNYNKNWYKSYNKASYNFNSRIGAINDKYKDVKSDNNGHYPTKRGQAYVKEVDKMWRTAYTKALKEDFGNDIAKKYIDNAPFMNTYSEFIRK